MKTILCTLFFSAIFSALFAQNWQSMAAGLLPNGYVIFSISAVGDNVAWAVASGEYYQGPIPATHHSRILRTSDGGLHWTVAEVEEAAGTISFQIVAEDSLTAWITTQDFGGGPGRALYKTTDGGLNWSRKLPIDAGGVALNRFADGQHWLAHNRQITTFSADGGTNWTGSIVTGYQTDEYQILTSGANLSNTVGDTVWSGTSSGRILRFTNYGESSQFINTGLGTTTTITSVAFQNHLHGLCYSVNAVNNRRIARSVNGGSTWTVLPQQPGNTIGWNIAAVPGAPEFYVLASNYSFTQGKVAITTNSGNSWSIDDLKQPLNAVVFTSPSTGWIGGGKIVAATQPAIFKYTGAALVGAPAPGELRGFSLSPNPVHSIVYVDFDDFAAANSVVATLTDLYGRHIFSSPLTDKQLDVSQLPAGAYFLKIETERGAAVRKIIRQ